MGTIIGNAHSMRRLAVTINGVPEDEFAEGDAIQFNRSGNETNTTVGEFGDYMVSDDPDDGGTIVINVAQSSQRFRARLLALARRQKLIGVSKASTFTVAATSIDTGEKVLCTECYFERLPDISFSRNQSARTFTLRTPNMQDLT